MDGSAITGFIGVGVLLIVNIGAVCFSYGRLSQKVADACKRLDKLEDLVINGRKT